MNEQLSELLHLLSIRRTVHDFAPGPLPPGLLERALHAAQWAPCHRHTWPWRFTRVGPQARERLADLAVELKQAELGATLGPEKAAAMRNALLHPAELLHLGCVMDPKPEIDRENYAALAGAVLQMQLVISHAGFGFKWSTGKLAMHSQVRSILHVPDDVRSEGFLLMGVPARVPTPPARPPLEQVYREVP